MPGPYIHISSMWHTAEQIGQGGYKPVPSDRINPDWIGDVVGGYSVVLIGRN